MSLESIDLNFLIEADINPLIIFSPNGHIIHLNSTAEILLGYTSSKELFEIAMQYAPQTYGHKTTTMDLKYNLFLFYGITIGYENDEYIYLRLYHKPRLGSTKETINCNTTETDINTLIEANIALFQIESDANIALLTDQGLPQIKIDQNRFSKLLSKSLKNFKDCENIDISLKLIIGEYIIIKEKKYQILALEIKSKQRDTTHDTELTSLTEDSFITISLNENDISLEIPFIAQ
ncbi:MAG: hypothetical protein JXQ68_00495 [Campylobacterales bacterium]|nr:hypothetical protein [Campylobacterales bacterium]